MENGDKKIIELNQVRTKLQSKAFEESKSLRFDVSPGKVIKGFLVQVKGYFTPTFTGSPTVEPGGIMAALVDSIAYYNDRGHVIKKITPEQARFQARYLRGQPAVELYKANATALGDSPSKGTLATPFALGTSTQNVAFLTAIEVPFEDVFTPASMSKTFYPVGKNVQNYIEVNTRLFKNIERYGGSDVSACTGTATIEISLIEAPAFMDDNPANYEIFRQTYLQPIFTGVQNDYPIDLPRQGRLAGLYLSLKDGTNRTLVNMDKANDVRFRLIKDGTKIVADATLLNLINENMTKRNIDDVVPGTAYMSLRNNSVYGTELPANTYSKLELQVTLPSSLSYNALLNVGIDDILPRLG